MRRPIRSPLLGIRVIALKVNIDTNTATSSVLIGNDDIKSISYVSTGILDVTFFHPFFETPIVLGNSITLAERACGLRGANTTRTGARFTLTDAAGTATDGDAYFLIIGRDSQFTDAFNKRVADVKGTRVNPRELLFHVDGTGTAAIINGKYDATLTDNGTGNYTLTFDTNFSSVPIVVGCATGTEASLAVTAASVSSVTVKTTDAGGNAADTDFYLWVKGWDSTSEHGRLRRTLKSTQRRCGLLPFQITYAAGVPSATLGTKLAASVDDDGTGNFGVNFAHLWKRADSVAIACASQVAGSFAHVVASATSAEVDVVDNGGTAQDESVDLVVFTFDTPDQT